MQVPDWLISLLTQFFKNMGLNLNTSHFESGHLALSLDNNAQLHIDIDSFREFLILTMRLPHRHDDGHIMINALKHNHFNNTQNLSPSVHMFEDDVVLRTCIDNSKLTLESLDRALSIQLQTNTELFGF